VLGIVEPVGGGRADRDFGHAATLPGATDSGKAAPMTGTQRGPDRSPGAADDAEDQSPTRTNVPHPVVVNPFMSVLIRNSSPSLSRVPYMMKSTS
jgi:hypothetical protein